MRQILVRPMHEGEISDERILGLQRQLDLEEALARAGGLDMEQNWDTQLSLHEQQLLAFLHIFLAARHFAFLDRASATLSAEQFQQILRLLSESSITYINNGEVTDALYLYDAVLEFGEDGAWTRTAKQAGPMIDAGSHVSK